MIMLDGGDAEIRSAKPDFAICGPTDGYMANIGAYISLEFLRA